MAAFPRYSSKAPKTVQIKEVRSKKGGAKAVFLQGRCDKQEQRDICD